MRYHHNPNLLLGWGKKAGVTRRIHSVFSLIITFVLIASIPVRVAATSQNLTPTGLPNVIDSADLFTEDQVLDLGALASRIGQQYSQDLVVVTIDDAEGKSSMEYADDYFDYEGYGYGENYSGMLFLIDMDNREIWLSTTGDAIQVMTDQRIDTLLDQAIVPMQNGNYSRAAQIFLEEAEFYLELGVPEGQYTTGPASWGLNPGEVIVSVLLAGGVFAVFYFAVRRRYRKRRMTWNYDLSAMAIANFPVFVDTLVNKFVTTRRVPQQSSSGGGGGGGRSSTHSGSSGRSHGGGGRGF